MGDISAPVGDNPADKAGDRSTGDSTGDNTGTRDKLGLGPL